MPRFLGAARLLLGAMPAWSADEAKPNTLTAQEIADGWLLLFDGATTFGWEIDGLTEVRDGQLWIGGEKPTTLRTTTEFGYCVLCFEFKLPIKEAAVTFHGQKWKFHNFIG